MPESSKDISLEISPLSSAKANISVVRDSGEIWLTNTGPRDTGQSDYKNRLMINDLIKLAPSYNQAGYWSIELHGGARFHQNLMNNKINPFDEVRMWRNKLPNVLTQTLIRATNVWGYRMYPKNVVKLAVKSFAPYIDVWRCFDFLNYVPNMIPVAEEVRAAGKIFEPAISFTSSPDATDEYYLKVVDEIVKICGGEDEIILCIKDMAGIGSPARIKSLVSGIKDRFPDLVIQYHRHGTDGLAMEALRSAAQAGANILDVTDDAFTRFYGQAPVRPLAAILAEHGMKVRLDADAATSASDIIRGFIRNYEQFENQHKGFSYDVIEHRMPGGAFPSSFEQADKGGFINLMPWILKGMSFGNKIIKYFDVTPGSQITWTTWVKIIRRKEHETGIGGVERLLKTVEKFLERGGDFGEQSDDDKEALLDLYSGPTDDLKNLLLGKYGPLPFGWPDDWVYLSVFGDDWEQVVEADRVEESPLSGKADEDVDASRNSLAEKIMRTPSDEELVLYLQHPQATVDFIRFREEFGDVTVLPSDVWFNGLSKPGDKVTFTLDGKPHEIQLKSLGDEVEGIKYIVMGIDNQLQVFPVEMPDRIQAEAARIRKADPYRKGEIAAPLAGTVWRIGDHEREFKEGDIVRKGQEVLNIEVMKTENAVYTPVKGTIKEILVEQNQPVEIGRLLMVIDEEQRSSDDE